MYTPEEPQIVEVPESWQRCEIQGLPSGKLPFLASFALAGVLANNTGTGLLRIKPIIDSDGNRQLPTENFPRLLSDLKRQQPQIEILFF